MGSFIDIHHLDYVNPNNIHSRMELKKFRQLSMLYRCQAAEFLIRNNLSRRLANGRIVVLRIIFKDIWEWHIAGEISEIIGSFKKQCIHEQPEWDCLWMLKAQMQNCDELFFCDIIFFGSSAIPENSLHKIIDHLNSERECVAQAVLLLQSDMIAQNFKNLQKLCHPAGNCQLRQCEFAYNI